MEGRMCSWSAWSFWDKNPKKTLMFIQHYKGGDVDFGSYRNIGPWKAGFCYEGKGYSGLPGLGRTLSSRWLLPWPQFHTHAPASWFLTQLPGTLFMVRSLDNRQQHPVARRKILWIKNYCIRVQFFFWMINYRVHFFFFMSDAGYSMLGAGAWGWPREMLWGVMGEGCSCLGMHVRIKDFKI